MKKFELAYMDKDGITIDSKYFATESESLIEKSYLESYLTASEKSMGRHYEIIEVM